MYFRLSSLFNRILIIANRYPPPQSSRVPGSILSYGYRVRSILHVLPESPWICSQFSREHVGWRTGYTRGANECVHGASQWTNIPIRMYSHLVPSVPGIGSRSFRALTRIKWFPKMQSALGHRDTMSTAKISKSQKVAGHVVSLLKVLPPRHSKCQVV